MSCRRRSDGGGPAAQAGRKEERTCGRWAAVRDHRVPGDRVPGVTEPPGWGILGSMCWGDRQSDGSTGRGVKDLGEGVSRQVAWTQDHGGPGRTDSESAPVWTLKPAGTASAVDGEGGTMVQAVKSSRTGAA